MKGKPPLVPTPAEVKRLIAENRAEYLALRKLLRAAESMGRLTANRKGK